MKNRILRYGIAAGMLGAFAACGPAAPPAAAPGAAAPAAERAAPPPPLADRPIHFPEFHEGRLDNGLRYVVVPHGAQPVANVSLYVLSGSTRDPADQTGRAGLAAELLTKGTTTRTALQISETIEGVGGSLGASAGNDWSSITASVLSEHLPLAFELLADVTLRPTFPADELELARRRTLSALQAQLGQPGIIADRRFRHELYGEHPYGRSPVPGTIQALRRDDVEAFHREHFHPANAILVVSGDVRPDVIEELARRHFAGWRATGPVQRLALPQPPAREAMRIYFVHRPGSVQSNIMVGHLGIRPDTPDFFALQVLNQIVGGGTDSRLFQILREEKGWTYGAYSRFTRPLDVGFFTAQAEVRNEVTDSAVVELLQQLRRIRDETVPTEEFDAAKSYLMGSFPLRLETAGQVGSQVAQTRLLGLPDEHLTEYRERIAAVTREDIQRVARQYVRPEQAAIVVVGDASQVLAQLEPIAPIVLYDVQGQPIERTDFEVRAAEERFDGARLRAGTRTYQLVVQGNPMGTVTSTLRREGDDWVASSVTESPVMSQEVEVRFGAADLTARSARQSTAQGPMRLSMELTAREGRLTGRAELPEQMGGNRDVDLEIPEGTILPGMDEYVLAAAELAEGREITVPMFNLLGANITNVTFRVTGAEEATVPAGTFPAYRVEVTGTPQPLSLLVRRDSPHILLRQEMTGAPVVLELTEM